MNASVKGALNQINTSWKAFTHNGDRMTKKQVRAVLEYADRMGYETTAELKDSEVNDILGIPNVKPDSLQFTINN